MIITHRFIRKLTKTRLRPIHVYCLHHVCKHFNPCCMNECDWIDIDVFKNKIASMQKNGIRFISLSEAYKKMTYDMFRFKEYAVLTFDDGYSSIKEILPWLEHHSIPVTLFINGKYLDGKSYRTKPEEKYLTKEELFNLNHSLIEIASHGWEHISINEMTDDEFFHSFTINRQLLSQHPKFINFFAYTYGHHRKETDNLLLNMNNIPVLINGGYNITDKNYVNRELFN